MFLVSVLWIMIYNIHYKPSIICNKDLSCRVTFLIITNDFPSYDIIIIFYFLIQIFPNAVSISSNKSLFSTFCFHSACAFAATNKKKRHLFPKCKNKDSPLTYLLIIFNISECNEIIPFKYNSTCYYRSLPYWGHSDNYINSHSHLQNKTKNYIRFTDINSLWINARKQVLKIRFYTARYLLVPQSKNCQWSIYD